MFKNLFLPIVVTTFISGTALSKDCSDLKNGEVVRLDSPGRSLENFRVQDQDGVGICYANSTSLLLQAVLPGNPEVSYIQVAALGRNSAFSRWRNPAGTNSKRAPKPGSDMILASKSEASEDGWQLGIEGGSICGTLENLKNEQRTAGRNVLCPRRAMNLEQMLAGGDAGSIQRGTLLNSARYMDLFHRSFSSKNSGTNNGNEQRTSENYSAFKNAFSNLIDQKKETFVRDNCRKLDPAGIENLTLNMLQNDSGNQDSLGISKCLLNRSEAPADGCAIANALVQNSRVKGFRVKIEGINQSFISRLQGRLQNVTNNLTGEKFKENFVASLLEESGQSARPEVRGRINRLLGQVSSEDINRLVNEANDIKQNGYSTKCVEQSLLTYLGGQQFKDDWEKDQVLCQSKDIMVQAGELVSEYKRSGMEGFGNVVDFLLEKAGLNYNDAMLSLYAFDCSDTDKISIPENLTCAREDVSLANKINNDRTIVNNLRNNRPLGVRLCAEVYDRPHTSAEYNTTCSPHIVSLTGIKCEDGAYKYLVQNSWGADNRPQNSTLNFEEGRGASWFDEKNFYSAVGELNTLTGSP